MENLLKCDYVWNNFKNVVVSFVANYEKEDEDYIPFVLTRPKSSAPTSRDK